MGDRLDGPRAKVERAKKHVGDLDLAHRAFFDSHPYVIGTKRNPETRQLIYYMVSVQAPPPVLSAIAGDVIQHLRSALDYLAQQLVVVGRGTPGPFSDVSFPICNSAAEYKAMRLRQVKGMRKEAIEAIDAVKPYKGGNDTLWMLHRLNNIDKHRLLVTVQSAFSGIDLFGHMHRDLARRDPDFWGDDEIPQLGFFSPGTLVCPLKPGDELFIDQPDAEVDEKLDFRFSVAFSEPKIAECEPVLPMLHQATDLVDNLLSSFEPLLR